MIVAIDFDGTIHTGEYPAIGQPATDAVKYIQRIKQDGHTIIIWSSRNGVPYREMVSWLDRYGIPYDTINQSAPENLRQYGLDTRKVYADIYIDDHNLGGLPPWEKIYRMIRNEQLAKTMMDTLCRQMEKTSDEYLMEKARESVNPSWNEKEQRIYLEGFRHCLEIINKN